MLAGAFFAHLSRNTANMQANMVSFCSCVVAAATLRTRQAGPGRSRGGHEVSQHSGCRGRGWWSWAGACAVLLREAYAHEVVLCVLQVGAKCPLQIWVVVEVALPAVCAARLTLGSGDRGSAGARAPLQREPLAYEMVPCSGEVVVVEGLFQIQVVVEVALPAGLTPGVAAGCGDHGSAGARAPLRVAVARKVGLGGGNVVAEGLPQIRVIAYVAGPVVIPPRIALGSLAFFRRWGRWFRWRWRGGGGEGQ